MGLKTIYWVLGISLVLSTNVFSQKSITAVMNVTVNVISGSTIKDNNKIKVNFKSGEVSHIGFNITPPKGVEIQISRDSTFTLVNQFGERLTLKSNVFMSEDVDTQSVNLKVFLVKPNVNPRGQYQGNLMTSIFYF